MTQMIGDYRALFEGVPLGLYRTAPDGRVLDANPAVLKMLGYPDLESLRRVNVLDSFVDPDRRREIQGRLADEGVIRDFEIEVRRRDGTTIRLLDHSRAVKGPDGEVLYYEGALQDITERKRAESDLRDANERLRAIIDSSHAAIFSVDPQGRVVTWNPAAERIFGWSEGEILGRPLPLIPETGREESEALFERLLAGESLSNLELRRQRRDGEPVDVILSAAPIRDGSGRITRMVASAIDITEQKAMEARVRESQKMEAIGQLAGGVAHDFNNLLTAVIGRCDLILDRSDVAGAVRSDVREIREVGDRAAALARQLLAFGRRQRLQPRRIDLNAVVEGRREMLQRLLGAEIDLATELAPDLWPVEADPAQVEHVIVNLALNARDAMLPEGGTLTIRTRNLPSGAPDRLEPGGDGVVLMVRDSGRGMDAETLAHAFEPFFTTKERGEASGLGLATVYGIVKQSGGEISLESEPGVATELRIRLPKARGAASADPDPGVDASAEPPTAPPQTGGRILLVEDEEAVRRVAARVLQMAGYTVTEAPDARSALGLAEREGPFDLVITDVVMPEMRGPELARRLAALGGSPRILFMSGYTETEVGAVTDAAEARFLEKPFSAEDLVRAVARLIEEGSSIG